MHQQLKAKVGLAKVVDKSRHPHKTIDRHDVAIAKSPKTIDRSLIIDLCALTDTVFDDGSCAICLPRSVEVVCPIEAIDKTKNS